MIQRVSWKAGKPIWSLILILLLVLVYLPSIFGGYLIYDDPVLITENVILQQPGIETLKKILFDFSYKTRLTLGAEYLPVRDLTHWVELQLFGLNAQLMRINQLFVYGVAVLLFRSALLRALGVGIVAEVAAWAFAFHPVHPESVAWLAGRKDVLALFFVALALFLYAGKGRRVLLAVPLVLSAAVFSKSMSVAAVALLPAMDL
ncbi:MAG: hypothetical protein MK135_08585, partial [Polyangiaceae bacterium]|nr:hypothetical protein [Polyangiaceae bacterium]